MIHCLKESRPLAIGGMYFIQWYDINWDQQTLRGWDDGFGNIVTPSCYIPYGMTMQEREQIL